MGPQKPVPGQIGCDACGRYHGSVTEHIKCLSAELMRKRLEHRQCQDALVKANEMIERVRKAMQ